MRKSKGILRKILLSLLLISPLFLYLSVVATIQFASPTEKVPYVHWTGLDPNSEVYISWETLQEESSHVKYGISSINLNLTYDNTTDVLIHHAKLSGLIPSTRYYYQVVDSGGAPFSGIGAFKSAPIPGETFNMTLISDTQQLWGIGHYNLIASAIKRNIEDTDFVAITGDVAQTEDDQRTWDYFFQVSEKYTNKFPLITLPGNHDGDNNNSLYTSYFTHANPYGRYFSFNWSNTQFIFAEIADGRDIHKGIPENDLHYEWINQTLENGQDKDYRVLMFHRQMLSSLGNGEELMANLIPVIEEYNVSLTIYGHDHSYERFFYQNHTYLCIGGGSGLQNVYVQTQESSEFHAMGPFLTYLEFSPSKIELKTVTTTNKVLDHVEFIQQGGYLVPHVVGGS